MAQNVDKSMRLTSVVQIWCSCWSLPSAELYSILEVNYSAYSYRIHTVQILFRQVQIWLTMCFTMSFQFLLRKDWRATLPKTQHRWVFNALFQPGQHGPVLQSRLQQPPLTYNQPPSSADAFFNQKLLLWMPYRMWSVDLKCIQSACSGRRLTACGLYKQVRQVVDLDGFYTLASEYLECGKCNKKYISWSDAILDQLDVGHRSQFPAILTYKYVLVYLI